MGKMLLLLCLCGMACFGQDGGYGFLDAAGFPFSYLDCDSVSSFQEGRAIVSVDGQYGYMDEAGELVIAPRYDDAGYFEQGLAKVRVGGYYGVIDKDGKEILPVVQEEIDMAELFGVSGSASSGRTSGHRITPRTPEFYRFAHSDAYELENPFYDGGDAVWPVSDGFARDYRLYRMGEEETPILYFTARACEQTVFPLSYSGFYTVTDDQTKCLVSGYQCGGSMGGDYACLWYDEEAGTVKMGAYESWGGFGGRAFGGRVYDFEAGEAKVSCRFMQTNQTTGNYEEEELLEHASLFYDDDGNPYNRENVLQADYVWEYRIDDVLTSREEYEAVAGRFRVLEYFP